jgi:hypothetical protein
MSRPATFKYTSIGRPVDPSYPTNKAVLVLMPIGGAIAAGVALSSGTPWGVSIIGAAQGLLVVFGAWALTREVAPDDNPAGFVGMAAAYSAFLIVGAPSLLLLFTTLGLVRIVNRSVGLPANGLDSVCVLGLTTSAMFSLDAPLLGLIGGVAFVFDAFLRDPRRSQVLFAMLCVAGSALYVSLYGVELIFLGSLSGAETRLTTFVAIGSVLLILQTGVITSVGDATGVQLSSERVRGGTLIALLLGSQALCDPNVGFQQSSAVLAALAGASLGRLWDITSSRFR